MKKSVFSNNLFAMMGKVIASPLEYRIIVELNSKHTMWDNTEMNDYYMIDLSNGDELYDYIQVSSDFGLREPLYCRCYDWCNVVKFIRRIKGNNKLHRIYVETF